MSALDKCHPQVVRAVEKDGWTVSPLPFTLIIDRRNRVFIDIEAHQNNQQIMIVEVKCFSNSAIETTDLYSAVGQYMIYRHLLESKNLSYPLYLAVPKHAYEGIIQRMAMTFMQKNDVKLIVVDLDDEVITRWMV